MFLEKPPVAYTHMTLFMWSKWKKKDERLRSELRNISHELNKFMFSTQRHSVFRRRSVLVLVLAILVLSVLVLGVLRHVAPDPEAGEHVVVETVRQYRRHVQTLHAPHLNLVT